MKIKQIEVKELYVIRVYLDDGTVVDFNVKLELDKIPCYKKLYDVELFKKVMFKNQRIYWDEQCDFHLDQILDNGIFIKNSVLSLAA